MRLIEQDKPVWYPRWKEFVTSIRNGKLGVNDLLAQLEEIYAKPIYEVTEAQKIDYVALHEALKALEGEYWQKWFDPRKERVGQ